MASFDGYKFSFNLVKRLKFSDLKYGDKFGFSIFIIQVFVFKFYIINFKSLNFDFDIFSGFLFTYSARQSIIKLDKKKLANNKTKVYSDLRIHL